MDPTYSIKLWKISLQTHTHRQMNNTYSGIQQFRVNRLHKLATIKIPNLKYYGELSEGVSLILIALCTWMLFSFLHDPVTMRQLVGSISIASPQICGPLSFLYVTHSNRRLKQIAYKHTLLNVFLSYPKTTHNKAH